MALPRAMPRGKWDCEPRPASPNAHPLLAHICIPPCRGLLAGAFPWKHCNVWQCWQWWETIEDGYINSPTHNHQQTSTNNITQLTHPTHSLNSLTQVTRSTHSLRSLAQLTHSTHSLRAGVICVAGKALWWCLEGRMYALASPCMGFVGLRRCAGVICVAGAAVWWCPDGRTHALLRPHARGSPPL